MNEYRHKELIDLFDHFDKSYYFDPNGGRFIAREYQINSNGDWELHADVVSPEEFRELLQRLLSFDRNGQAMA